ncbi:NYN domain-containing protein [Acinetobacter johnsonii]|uniref:NYN domain-containing protein n=1 Tax=Acinetobacter johnsonii TaxID=40214 RepID=A0AA42MSD4_ACIJO|nr:NYN domain-containing protein [Acinetobacter johnsonii]MDH0968126.1 NYN domain-containing protein [Acinetobacter johnsonii]QQT92850.1 NYN domain-containing protein [Acinetobacter johnsonii]QYA55567.1 NYN domain-containing protein [Acinetobacter johnsonii]
MDIQTKKFAVLIDADNSSIGAIPSVLEEVAKYGIASVKRVYGDWSSETLKNWREVLLPHAITPVQQFAYTKGKDATDMILIIDAMDLLYAGALDGFCIVSSDSDFTPLASRIRENGLSVYGFGKKKTPEAFKKACDKFIYVENLIVDSDLKNIEEEYLSEPTDKKLTETLKTVEQKALTQSKEYSPPETVDRATLNLIYKAVKDNADENGWANLSMVGQYISAVKPDFDSRNYGRAKLSGLIKTLNLFETKIEMSQMYLRKMKKQSTS